jgi:hypothetical protein
MVNFGDAGRICLNQDINGKCENCLWWEWDSQRRQCSNYQYHICPLYRERLFSVVSQAWSRRILRTKQGPQPSDAGSNGQPVSGAGESGTS